MPKFLLSLSLLAGITMPAHADTIYHNFFTVGAVIGNPSDPLIDVYQFILPIGDVPNSTSCGPPEGCTVRYLDVPYYNTLIPFSDDGIFPNVPPLSPDV
jgi:hypothetical protein